MLGWLSFGFTLIFTFAFHRWTSCQLHLKNKSLLTSWKAKLLKDKVTEIVVLPKEVLLSTVFESAIEYWTSCTENRSSHLPSLLLHLGFNFTCPGSYSVKSHPSLSSPPVATVSLPEDSCKRVTHCNTWSAMFVLCLLCSVSLRCKGISTSYLLFTETIIDPASKNVQVNVYIFPLYC